MRKRPKRISVKQEIVNGLWHALGLIGWAGSMLALVFLPYHLLPMWTWPIIIVSWVCLSFVLFVVGGCWLEDNGFIVTPHDPFGDYLLKRYGSTDAYDIQLVMEGEQRKKESLDMEAINKLIVVLRKSLEHFL